MRSNMPMGSRYRGALLGLATGDALGASLEFELPGTFAPIDDMLGGGPFDLAPGEWTDDTAMALCLAESLIETGGFDPVDQLERYVRWWRDGYLSSTGDCFDIGIQTRAALGEFERTRSATPANPDEESCGNGSTMRLGPVPLFFAGDLDEAVEMSGRSSLTTHPAPRCVDACRYLGALTAAAANGTPKDELLDPAFWRWGDLHPEIEQVARGSFLEREPPEIKGSGYVVRSLEAALWAFHRSDNFREGALLAVNLGDDADTTGAVFGQIAGAYYGEAGIPDEWLAKVARRDEIEHLADRLLALAGATS